jgi:hypothetical protein
MTMRRTYIWLAEKDVRGMKWLSKRASVLDVASC